MVALKAMVLATDISSGSSDAKIKRNYSMSVKSVNICGEIEFLEGGR